MTGDPLPSRSGEADSFILMREINRTPVYPSAYAERVDDGFPSAGEDYPSVTAQTGMRSLWGRLGKLKHRTAARQTFAAQPSAGERG